ncbi:hypothetical protein IM792_14125 [Mucilaginibacter sp. JRF]|uniref:DUF6252 family protein n=1 Tax=Mucilaginibacter sp. JRF TaxID=2780088 RepID=UPI00187E0A37|nr:DUF6252 family protein [Mucilaginibacter sp. JRF]MBE9585589.1 hypothetical protein [Mucilaginibacter sp. JRF]
MKAKLLIALLAAASLFTACSKDQKEDDDVIFCCAKPGNFISATKADTTWRTNELALSHDKDSLVLIASANGEKLRLSIKLIDTGKYAITPINGIYNVTLKGNTTASEYRATADTSNYINVITYSPATYYINGEFKAKFVKIANSSNADLPDTISFTKGRFRAAIPK